MQTLRRNSVHGICGMGLLAGLVCCFEPRTGEADRPANDDILMFQHVLERIQMNYPFRDLTRRELIEAAVEGMLLKWDPDGEYFDSKDLSYFNQFIVPRGGVGLMLRAERRLVVGWTRPGQSAYEAGIVPGDALLEIDGQDVCQMRAIQASIRLSGKPGTTVTVKVAAVSGGEVRIVKLQRTMIKSKDDES